MTILKKLNSSFKNKYPNSKNAVINYRKSEKISRRNIFVGRCLQSWDLFGANLETSYAQTMSFLTIKSVVASKSIIGISWKTVQKYSRSWFLGRLLRISLWVLNKLSKCYIRSQVYSSLRRYFQKYQMIFMAKKMLHHTFSKAWSVSLPSTILATIENFPLKIQKDLGINLMIRRYHQLG